MLVFLFAPFSHANDGCVCTLYLDLFTPWYLIEITPYQLAEIVLSFCSHIVLHRVDVPCSVGEEMTEFG